MNWEEWQLGKEVKKSLAGKESVLDEHIQHEKSKFKRWKKRGLVCLLLLFLYVGATSCTDRTKLIVLGVIFFGICFFVLRETELEKAVCLIGATEHEEKKWEK